jgi:hypothetical protein
MAMKSPRRIPIAGWQRCVHEAASFESRGEFKAAQLLDISVEIEWWIRNDPEIFKISTPVGNFEPDFLYRALRAGRPVMGILEIKGAIFWDGEGSKPRIQADAACEWVNAINKASRETRWEFATVLDQDACDAHSLGEMLVNAQRRTL